jgi:hypothetical protein
MFRFSIRELLILTVTAGLAVGWWADRRQIPRLKRELAEQFSEANQWRTCAGGLEQILKHDACIEVEPIALVMPA